MFFNGYSCMALGKNMLTSLPIPEFVEMYNHSVLLKAIRTQVSYLTRQF